MATIKGQFMSLWDGLITDATCQIIVVGATNRPQDVDAAILRRMSSKFSIGKPVSILLKNQNYNKVVDKVKRKSGSYNHTVDMGLMMCCVAY